MFSVIRFDLRAPGLDPPEAQRLYAASLEMSEWADRPGFDMLVLTEHHASPDGYLPSPLVMGAAVAARTTRIPHLGVGAAGARCTTRSAWPRTSPCST